MSVQRTVASWSGGKDSCLALHRAMNLGYGIERLVNFVSRESGRCCFHGVRAELLRLQASLMNIPLVQHAVSPSMAEYEKEFKAAVAAIGGIEAMVFGDVYLEEHRQWVERVCRELNLEAVEPLWGEKPADVVGEFIRSGFTAVVVSCQADKFGREFVGRQVDRRMMDELLDRGICPCGENGEFHTLVVDGPMFSRGIRILEAEPVLKDGFWKHWFLDIRKYA